MSTNVEKEKRWEGILHGNFKTHAASFEGEKNPAGRRII